MNMISQLRQRIARTGTATIITEEFNQLQAEWITRTKMEKDELIASPVERLVSTDKHPDLIAWEEEHNKPLYLGCKVTILETCEYFDADYDKGKTFIVVMMFVDSGGLNMGLNDGQNDSYLCETDGYYIADLVPA